MLNVLDERWKDHLYDLDQLRNAIQYRAWGQKDPLVEYKREAFEMFEDLMHDIQSTFTERFLKIQVSAERPEPPRAAAAAAGRRRRAPVRADQRGRRSVHGAAAAGSAPPPVGRGPGAAPGGHQLARAARPGDRGGAGGGAERSRVPAGRGRSTRSVTGWDGRPRLLR